MVGTCHIALGEACLGSYPGAGAYPGVGTYLGDYGISMGCVTTFTRVIFQAYIVLN